MLSNRKIPLAELLRSLLPITVMGWALLVGIGVLFINWALAEGPTLFGSVGLKRLFDLLSLLALVPLFWFAVQGARTLGQRLLWRLRRRLIVTYLLIGALPILLLVLLVIIFGSVSVMHLAERQFDEQVASSQATAEALARELAAQTQPAGQATAVLDRELQRRAGALQVVFPGLELQLVDLNKAASDAPAAPAAASALPGWLARGGEFHGLVVEEDATDGGRRIHVRHVAPVGAARLVFSQPINAELCARLGHGDVSIRPGRAAAAVVITPQGPSIDQTRSLERDETGRPPRFQFRRLPIVKPVTEWSSGRQFESDVLLVELASLNPWRLWRDAQAFRSGSTVGNLLVWAINLLTLIFVLIALAAIVSAVLLTRSITGAVHHLYQGTRRVEAGDLEHEIPVRQRDQLGALGLSFNQMTRSIRELLRVSAEKQRLDQEMKIAAEVQARLFPRALPTTEKLDFAPGVCIPARSVSGDYYDFFNVAPGVVAVTVADVCGKGVSAALMMSNLQANLRGQVEAHHRAGAPAVPVSRIVQKINAQIARAMIDASYITFFYAEFDERVARLRYTNAGHNAPLLLRHNGAVERLEVGGTVLGLFPEVEYEDAELTLTPGDLVIAFTDGLAEAQSPRGEEFGEERLLRVAQQVAHLPAAEIERQIIDRVKAWVAQAEQADDLTLVVFKVR